jgi:hypothetical protein
LAFTDISRSGRPIVAVDKLSLNLARAGRIVINSSIAVVVGAIADFGRTGWWLAPFMPIFAGPLPLGADAQESGFARGTGKAFVDGSVAVFVRAVADLVDGRDCIPGAANCPVLADKLPFSAGALPGEARFTEAEALVGVAVAVVVDVVACYLGAGDTGAGVANGVCEFIANQLSLPTAGAQARVADFTETEVFIGDTVAVLVLAPADLGAGLVGLGVAGSVAVGIADDLSVGLAGADAFDAGKAEFEVLVGVAIAIVVGSITDLVGRVARSGIALHTVGGTDFYPLGDAFAYTGTASTPHSGSVINLAVAVVVEAVADLCSGQDLSFAGVPLVFVVASLCSTTAAPSVFGIPRAGIASLTVGAHALAVHAFVGDAVAVVVSAVADFFSRLACLNAAGSFTLGACDHAGDRAGTFAFDAIVAQAKVFVSVAIAVVVDAVATLCIGIIIPTTDCCTVLADK